MDAVSKSLVSLRIDKDEDCPSYVHSARLYVVADQTARPGFYHWSFKIYNEKTEKWTTYEVRKSPADKYPVKHVHDAVPGTTGLDFRLFELVSIPCHWLPEVYKACESARVPGVGALITEPVIHLPSFPQSSPTTSATSSGCPKRGILCLTKGIRNCLGAFAGKDIGDDAFDLLRSRAISRCCFVNMFSDLSVKGRRQSIDSLFADTSSKDGASSGCEVEGDCSTNTARCATDNGDFIDEV
ncbi:hypothetical protein HG530_010508 [Fusarium avenaceum]|nr:hypothetical protein HG530_010508 [Fusarium avenaceum]